MLARIALLIVITITSRVGYSDRLDSLLKSLDNASLEKQLVIIRSIDFNTVVENTNSIIVILKKYESIAYDEKDFSTLAKIYSNLSLAYYYRGKYDENLKYGLKAANLFDSLGNRSDLGTMYGELGYQMKYRDMKGALELMRKGIRVLEELNNPEPLAKIYDNYGVLKEISEQLDSAVYFYRKALDIKIKRSDSYGIPFSLNNLFMANLLLKKPLEALNYINESTAQRIRIKDSVGLAENFGYYGLYFSEKGDFNRAVEYNTKSLEIAKKHGYKNLMKSRYLDLSQNFEKLGDYRQALIYHRLFSNMQDSLINLETNKTIADLQVQYETSEKEKELINKNRELERQKTIKLFVLIIALVIVVAITVFFWGRQIMAKRNERIKLQMALIEGEQSERNRIAMELHDGIANDLNAAIMSLNNYIDKDLVHTNEGIEKLKSKLKDSHQNVRKLSHSLMPRSLREKGLNIALGDLCSNFSTNELSIHIQSLSLESRLPQFIELNVYRIVQESINNIIKHSQATNVQIDCTKTDGMLHISIEDDGVGFKQSEPKSKEGLGLLSIYNRVHMMDGNLSIRSVANEGTTIDIQIPIKQ